MQCHPFSFFSVEGDEAVDSQIPTNAASRSDTLLDDHSSPPPLPEASAEDIPGLDPLTSSSNPLEDDRVIGGDSLPALKANSISSEDSDEDADQGGKDEIPLPAIQADDDDDVDAESELKEVLQKKPDSKAIFEDSDSDDSLFANKLSTSKPKSQ